MLVGSTLSAQDPIFSLQQTSPMNYNPAHVGNTDFTRLIIGYRNQYPSYSNVFSTYTASFDTYFNDISSGVGIAVAHDEMSKTFKETSVGFTYSYNLKISDNAYLRAGLQALLRFQSQNPGNLIFPDMIDPNGSIIPNPIPYNSWNTNSFDLGAGLAFMAGPFKLGIAAFNISGQKQESYSGIELPNPLRINAYTSFDIYLSSYDSYAENTRVFDVEMMSISPNVQYSQQYDYKTLSLGVFFKAGTFFIGLHERQDIDFESITFSLSAGVEVGRIGIGLSGDIAQLGSISNTITSTAVEANVSIKLWENKDQSFSRGYHNKRYLKSSGGMRIENRGIDKKRVRRYKCPY